MSAPSDSQRMEKIVSLCKRRGFIFQSSEIYGGLNGVWDYGPLGVELKRNLKNYWWHVMVHQRMPPIVFQIPLELDAERAVIPHSVESAINLAGLENES